MGFGLTNGATAQVPAGRRSGVWRLVLSWTLLIAFSLQSYATQTHAHWSSIAAVTGNASFSAASSFASPQSGDPDSIACPFCQAIAAAGAFVGPAPADLSLPVLRAETTDARPTGVGLAVNAAGFSWRSRAPPQL